MYFIKVQGIFCDFYYQNIKFKFFLIIILLLSFFVTLIRNQGYFDFCDVIKMREELSLSVKVLVCFIHHILSIQRFVPAALPISSLCQRIRKRYLNTFRTSVINSPMFPLSVARSGREGTLGCYYTSPKSIKITFSYLLAQQLL